MESKFKKESTIKISQINFIIFILLLNIGQIMAQIKTYTVESFDKVIVSPHIQVNFEQGDKETVLINDITVSIEKLNIEVSGKTLHIYLDDAKYITKNETENNNNNNNHKVKRPIYNGTAVKATIFYKNLNELSLRGEQKFICKSTLNTDKFRLIIYGESEVTLNEVKLKSLSTTIYGESILNIKKGSIEKQKITAYGESEINSLAVETESIKITVYGESEIKVNASKSIKITSYGEADIRYSGNPEINKGIIIGDTSIKKIN